MSGWENVEPTLDRILANISEVRESSWAKGRGAEWSPKRSAVQQLAGMMLEKLHDADGLPFAEIAQLLRDERGQPLTGERVRVLYHRLTQIDDDLRRTRKR